MQKQKFYKYHGAGNDFIMIDNRDGRFDITDVEKIKLLCHRRFGIGADGVLILEKTVGFDFKMIYLNADGKEGSMCGNGGRCIVHFAHFILKIIKNPKKVKFLASDGAHEAQILKNGNVKLKMQDIEEITKRNGLPFLCSGNTPHNIMYVQNLKKFPVFETGKKIRYRDPNGVNVNFVEIKNGKICARTYERGVEDETMACGTGATCIAIASHHLGKFTGKTCKIKMPGGELTVEFTPPANSARQGLAETNKSYTNIWLEGPAVCVFEGKTQ